MKIQPSTRKDKKLMVTFSNGKVVHFGAKGSKTYLDTGDAAKRRAYLARHAKGGEDWLDPYTPGALSRWLLWGDSTSLEANHQAFMKRFNVS
jgi:hypothetical protein